MMYVYTAECNPQYSSSLSYLSSWPFGTRPHGPDDEEGYQADEENVFPSTFPHFDTDISLDGGS